MAEDVIGIDQALAQEGLEDPASVARARQALDAAKLTNPNRSRMSREKLPRFSDFLHQTFAFHCTTPDCRNQAARSGRELLLARKDSCEVCGGSNTRRAVQRMLESCAAAGISSVCLVGGSPGVREELQRRIGTALKITLVDGTQTPSSAQARAHVRGHDVTVICGSSELSHKLSNTYCGVGGQNGVVITAPRRGVESIAEALTQHARGRAAHRGSKA